MKDFNASYIRITKRDCQDLCLFGDLCGSQIRAHNDLELDHVVCKDTQVFDNQLGAMLQIRDYSCFDLIRKNRSKTPSL